MQQKTVRCITIQVLTAITAIGLIFGLSASSVTSGYAADPIPYNTGPTTGSDFDASSRISDPDTMNSYQNELLSTANGSRYAGRVWTDKTDFAYGQSNGNYQNNVLKLNMANDGIDSSVASNADFLHAFSTFSSSQVVNEYPSSPIDMVLMLDISSSMSDKQDLADYTVAVDLRTDSDDWVSACPYPMMDPESYFKAESDVHKTVPNTRMPDDILELDEQTRKHIGQAWSDLQEWIKNEKADKNIERKFPLTCTKSDHSIEGAFIQDEGDANKYGLSDARNYHFTEEFDSAEITDGYRLREIVLMDALEDQTTLTPRPQTADGYTTYSAGCQTGAFTEPVHFTNTYDPVSLDVSKTIQVGEGIELSDCKVVKLSDLVGDDYRVVTEIGVDAAETLCVTGTVNGLEGYTAFPTEAGKGVTHFIPVAINAPAGTVVRSKTLTGDAHYKDVSVDDTGRLVLVLAIATDEDTAGKLKGGETIQIDGLDSATDYTVTEAGSKGWKAKSGEQTAELGKDLEVNGTTSFAAAPIGTIAGSSQSFTNIRTADNQKEEVEPGADLPVQVGEKVHYTIHWANNVENEGDTATITVTDPLDSGVDFVSATIPGAGEGGGALTLSADTEGGKVTSGTDGGVSIAYDDASRTVTWKLGQKNSGEFGTVDLWVKVNSNAIKTWEYSDTETGASGEGDDYKIVNRARIEIGNTSVYTDIVENPVPDKTETTITPGSVGDDREPDDVNPPQLNAREGDTTTLDGPAVFVGDTITYDIGWANTDDQDAYVTISDTLDPGVDFVSASYGGVKLDDPAKSPAKSNDGKVEIAYDATSRTVTWNLNVTANTNGAVQLDVKVNASATPAGKVDNKATVTIHDKPVVTHQIENPTPEVHKTEPQPGAGAQVNQGDRITYQISWRNYQPDTARVTITDHLDPGLTFDSASFGDVTLSASDESPKQGTDGDRPVEISYEGGDDPVVTWVLDARPQGDEGVVTLVVKVNDQAEKLYTYDSDGTINGDNASSSDDVVWNQAGVQVGHDPTVLTEIIPNYTKPRKDEIAVNDLPVTPTEHVVDNGTTVVEGPEVNIGDTILYRISWQNTATDALGQSMPATVTVHDNLDPGVTYVDAGFMNAAGEAISAPDGCTVSYEPQAHAVTWTLAGRSANERGFVYLKVKVDADAATYYTYDAEGNVSALSPGQTDDDLVLDMASVTVGNKTNYTNLVENPLGDAAALTVRKTVTGEGADHTQQFHFTVTLYADPAVTGDFGGMMFTNNVAEFTLTDGQTVTATGLPADVSYEVVEDSYVDDGYTTTSENATGTLKAGAEAEASFVNDKSKQEETSREGPHKIETVPGDGSTVQIGDKITYRIEYENYQNVPTTVTVRDPLDPGMTYESSKPAGNYDPTTHTIIWTFDEVPGHYKGEIYLTVTVNEGALKTWKPNQFAQSGLGGAEDAIVYNQAYVQVGADDEMYTEIPENPLIPDPEKTEPDPGPGQVVYPDEDVTYQITWYNTEETPADITITDQLDPGVDFVGAIIPGAGEGGDDLVLTAGDTLNVEYGDCSIAYDSTALKVTWQLNDRPAYDAEGGHGVVTLIVSVRDDAKLQWDNETSLDPDRLDYRILNRASVQVNDDPARDTNTVENPTGPEKIETTAGDATLERNPDQFVTDPDGNITGPVVSAGDILTYEVHWYNTARDEDGQPKAASIFIRDPLDPGVDFVEASIPAAVVGDDDGLTLTEGSTEVTDGQYRIAYGRGIIPNVLNGDANNGVVIWDLGVQEADASGIVVLKVRANAHAIEQPGAIVDNQAVVEVDNQTTPTNTNKVENKDSERAGLAIEKTHSQNDRSGVDGDPKDTADQRVGDSDEVTYFIRVQSTGTGQNTGVEIWDEVPAGMTLIEDSIGPTEYIVPGNDHRYTIAHDVERSADGRETVHWYVNEPMESGDAIEVFFTVDVPAAAGGQWVNTAHVKSDQTTDPSDSNTVREYSPAGTTRVVTNTQTGKLAQTGDPTSAVVRALLLAAACAALVAATVALRTHRRRH